LDYFSCTRLDGLVVANFANATVVPPLSGSSWPTFFSPSAALLAAEPLTPPSGSPVGQPAGTGRTGPRRGPARTGPGRHEKEAHGTAGVCLTRGPNGIRVPLNLIKAYPDQAHGYQPDAHDPRGGLWSRVARARWEPIWGRGCSQTESGPNGQGTPAHKRPLCPGWSGVLRARRSRPLGISRPVSLTGKPGREGVLSLQLSAAEHQCPTCLRRRTRARIRDRGTLPRVSRPGAKAAPYPGSQGRPSGM
jgi:hypothetical protein